MRVFSLLCLFLLISCHAPVPERRLVETPVNKRGIHLLLDDGRSAWSPDIWPIHLQEARELVGEWGFVTQLIRLDDLDVTKWQTFMDLCAELHLTPMIRLATVYDMEQQVWIVPPDSAPQQYADFLAQLDWPTEQHFIVVGNEVNHGEEWGGRPDPSAYVAFLRQTAVLIKQQDPHARLLNAPLDLYTPHSGERPFDNGFYYMDAETFMDEMWQADPDIFAYLDAWASHPYPEGPFSAPPEQASYQFDRLNGATNPHAQTPPVGIYNRGLKGYEWELWKLSTYGVEELPVFITETGWRYGDGYPDPDTLTAYWAEASELWFSDARIYGVTPFALNGHPTEWHHTNWLVVTETGEIVGELPFAHIWQSFPMTD